MTRHGDVRQRILDAAEQRLWHYGFKKTTIDEIASDAGVGKGTVYLYFESKEDIGLAIMTQFKENNLREVAAIAAAPEKTPVEKLKAMLCHPIISAIRRCSESPATLEMVVAMKPHIQARMLPYLEQECALIASVLAEGNREDVFEVAHPVKAARTLKMMCMGFLPPYPCVPTEAEIVSEVSKIVDLTVRGLRKR